MGGPEIERLIELLGKLPGLGPRSARRAALGLLRHPQARMLPLANAMQQAARTVRSCALCGNLDSRDPCTVCADPGRDRGLICVVEGVGDLWALERAGVHRGLYHVLGGTLSPLGGVGPEDLNLSPLLARLERAGLERAGLERAGLERAGLGQASLEEAGLDRTPVREVILALGATVEGATTAHWLSERLAPFAITISRVGQGVPMGGALDVLDDGTLAAALTARRPS